jgi:hypothetical protein
MVRQLLQLLHLSGQSLAVLAFGLQLRLHLAVGLQLWKESAGVNVFLLGGPVYAL